MLSIQIRDVSMQGVVFLLLVLMTTATAKTYRWVDENDKVYYSNSIPPSAAQNGHTEMHEKSGRVLGDIASRREREKAKQQILLLKKAEKIKQLKMREELALQLFSSRAEAEKHFKRRLEMVSVNLRLLQYHKRKLLKSITKIQQSAEIVKTRKEKRQLSNRLRKIQSTLLEHTRAIDNNKQEQILTSANRQRALRKYAKGDYATGTSSAENNQKSGCSCTCEQNKAL